jgi:hypothetical protein
MRRRAVGAGVLAVGVVAAMLAGGGTADAARKPGHQVLAGGLNNPRQLNWTENGKTLIISEAGRGGDTCLGDTGSPEGPACFGFTGAIRTVTRPWNKTRVTPRWAARGFFSAAGPDGEFATGVDGADKTDIPGEFIAAITGAPPELRPSGLTKEMLDQLGHLVVAETHGPGQALFPYLDFWKYEKNRNPDKAQLDSNPYGILFIKSKAGDGSGYALVADAAANTVWKVDPDLTACEGKGEDCVPPPIVRVFYKWNPPGPPGPVDDEDIEYVPTSVAQDRHGFIYVGGLGSLQPGKGKVTKFTANGRVLKVFKDFTSVTGVAVDLKDRLYVSELFGGATGDPFAPGAAPSGTLTRVAGSQRLVKKVPFPAGVAVDNRFNVYVSENSLMAGKGQVWRIRYRSD